MKNRQNLKQRNMEEDNNDHLIWSMSYFLFNQINRLKNQIKKHNDSIYGSICDKSGVFDPK